MRPFVPVRSSNKEMVCNRSPTLLSLALLTHSLCSDALEPFCGTYAFPGDTSFFDCMVISMPFQNVEFFNDFYITAIGSTLCTRSHYKPFRLHRCLSQTFPRQRHQLRLSDKLCLAFELDLILRVKLRYNLHPFSQWTRPRRNRRHRSWCRRHRRIDIWHRRILLPPRPQAQKDRRRCAITYILPTSHATAGTTTTDETFRRLPIRPPARSAVYTIPWSPSTSAAVLSSTSFSRLTPVN